MSDRRAQREKEREEQKLVRDVEEERRPTRSRSRSRGDSRRRSRSRSRRYKYEFLGIPNNILKHTSLLITLYEITSLDLKSFCPFKFCSQMMIRWACTTAFLCMRNHCLIWSSLLLFLLLKNKKTQIEIGVVAFLYKKLMWYTAQRNPAYTPSLNLTFNLFKSSWYDL